MSQTEEVITQNPITPETCFVPKTHEGKGRRTSVAPGATAARYLHYGRITLDAGDAALKFSTNDHETGLICLKGSAKVSTNGGSFQLNQYDAVYVPRDSQIEVEPASDSGCDLAEVSAPVEKQYPVKFVSYKEVRGNPRLHLIAGKPPAERSQRVDRRERRSRADHGRRHFLHSWELDFMAAARTLETFEEAYLLSTCPRRRSACSLFTPIRSSRSWSRWCAKAIAC